MSDDTQTPRKCLDCKQQFPSSWIGERICPSCKSGTAYKSASVTYGEHEWTMSQSDMCALVATNDNDEELYEYGETLNEYAKTINDYDKALPSNHDHTGSPLTFNGINYPNQGE